MTLSILEDLIDDAYADLDTIIMEKLNLTESVFGALYIIDTMIRSEDSDIDPNEIYKILVKELKDSEDDSYTNLLDNINKVNDFFVNSYGKYWKSDAPDGFDEFIEYLSRTCIEIRESDDIMSALNNYIKLAHDLYEGNYDDDDDSDDSINTEEINDR